VFVQFKGDSSQVLGLNATHVGDFTGDGFGDFIGTAYGEIGSGFGKEEDVGRNYLVTGRDEDDLPTGNEGILVSETGPASWYGDNEDDLVGLSVANLGDINGDNEPDFAIGRDDKNSDEALAFIFLGGGTVPSTGAVEDRAQIELFSNAGLDCPCTVGGIGDINSDGFDDIAVGVTEASGGGKIFIVYGSSFSKGSAPSSINVESAAAKIITGEASGDQAGFSIAGRGDVNGDGKDDFIVSAIGKDAAAGNDAGKVYVFLGY